MPKGWLKPSRAYRAITRILEQLLGLLAMRVRQRRNKIGDRPALSFESKHKRKRILHFSVLQILAKSFSARNRT